MKKPLKLLAYVIAFGIGACDGDSVSEPVIELPGRPPSSQAEPLRRR
jgi:hypothetical protein